MTLTDFLLNRIAEDERAAQTCSEVFPAPWDVTDRGHSATVRADEPHFGIVAEIDQAQETPGRWPGEHLEHIARHDPARVLAECESKRRIVEMFEDNATSAVRPMGEGIPRDALALIYRGGALASVMKCLALPYADHPDYREEWRP